VVPLCFMELYEVKRKFVVIINVCIAFSCVTSNINLKNHLLL